MIAPTRPAVEVHSDSDGEDDETQHAPEDSHRSTHPSPRESANESVHNYVDIDSGKDKESPPRIAPFVNQLGRPLNADKEELFLSDSNVSGLSQRLSRPAAHHDSLIGAPLSQARGTLRDLHMEDRECSCSGEIYILGWSIPRRCRGDSPVWCQEMMVHRAPPVAQEESNALPNHIALERAWFTLAKGAMAQTDILERFENVQDDYTRLAKTHDECFDTVRKLVTARQDLKQNAKLFIPQCKRRTNYQLSTRIKLFRFKSWRLKMNYLRRILPRGKRRKCPSWWPVVSSKSMSKKSLSEPFNIEIQAGWGKGLSEGRTDEEILNALRGASNFDAYSDKKLYLMYDKLFEKEYPFIMKIATGYRHSVSDLLKVHPDPAPSDGTSVPTISTSLAGPPDLLVHQGT
ncbi:hypothetical protein Tco_1359873 [Tanacetum coccineum]